MAVPVLGTFLLPGWTGEDQGVLVWLTSLVPAFLLTYYRGLKGVALDEQPSPQVEGPGDWTEALLKEERS
jgi:hypothetical protein